MKQDHQVTWAIVTPPLRKERKILKLGETVSNNKLFLSLCSMTTKIDWSPLVDKLPFEIRRQLINEGRLFERRAAYQLGDKLNTQDFYLLLCASCDLFCLKVNCFRCLKMKFVCRDIVRYGDCIFATYILSVTYILI